VYTRISIECTFLPLPSPKLHMIRTPTNSSIQFEQTNFGTFTYAHLLTSSYFHKAMRTNTPTEAVLCCPAVWKRRLPRLRGTMFRACLVASFLGGTGGSERYSSAMEHLVHSFDGWTLMPHCCVMLRFCLSGGIRNWEVYKQLSRICAIYVRILR